MTLGSLSVCPTERNDRHKDACDAIGMGVDHSFGYVDDEILIHSL
jgi:hypothetical protein